MRRKERKRNSPMSEENVFGKIRRMYKLTAVELSGQIIQINENHNFTSVCCKESIRIQW